MIKEYRGSEQIEKYRRAYKRTIMTKIYGATNRIMLKYCKKGLKEEGIEEEEKKYKRIFRIYKRNRSK